MTDNPSHRSDRGSAPGTETGRTGPAPMRGLRRVIYAAATVIAGCTSPPAGPPATGPGSTPPSRGGSAGLPGAAGPAGPGAPGAPAQPRTSTASNPREYRVDAASHLYALNTGRIFKGRLPPMLYSIGVLDVHVDRQGRVVLLDWLRQPRAPEVKAEIERTVRAAAPFPVAERLGRVVYTDTWLWDRSGNFQLDTLTEGQRSEL